MSPFPSEFEFSPTNVAELKDKLASLGASIGLLKLLPQNANDKNQIYIGSDFGVVADLFALTFAERGASASLKDVSITGRRISEAAFDSFAWVKRDGSTAPVKRMKLIIYPQYPEARLSGFQTVDNSMPQSLSIAFTKANPSAKRLLVLGQLPRGGCVGMVCVGISPQLEAEVLLLPSFERSKVCKRLTIRIPSSDQLKILLSDVVGKNLRGCRMDINGKTLPFAGTQVCGYTLEHALNILPNASSAGDIFGIELKTHTQAKVTLFTPEPDLGLYADDFATFMRKYGYKDENGDLRLTGIHRANVRCNKSGLTLKLREYKIENGVRIPSLYNPRTALSSKVDAIEAVLESDSGELAAGWSLERLMNCWGAKHNEVVYIQATKLDNLDVSQHSEGYEYIVNFSPRVMWCRETSAERLLAAINDGVIFLDPAPKLHSTDPSKHKRRAQWRVNDIAVAAKALYATVEFKDMNKLPAAA